MSATEVETASVEQGLDHLELARTAQRPLPLRVGLWLLPKVGALAFLVVIWEVVVLLGIKKTYAVPPPLTVASRGSSVWQAGNLQEAVITSLHRAAEGYVLSLFVGTALGIAIARINVVRVSLASLVAALQSLPSVTWVPIGLIWFGPTETTIYFVVIMGALPSIAGGTVAALDQVPPLLLKVGRSMGARGLSLYRHVILSAALPGYVAGLKQAWAFSWRSLMAAELITQSPSLGFGLGQLLDQGHSLLDMPLMIVAIIAILVVGILVEELVFAPLDLGIRRRRGLAA